MSASKKPKPKPPGKDKGLTAAPARDKPQPRRRDKAPAAYHPELYKGGSLRTAMTADTAEMAAATQMVTDVAEEIALPDITPDEREVFSGAAYERQARTTFSVAAMVAAQPELAAETQVQPEDLYLLINKESQLQRIELGMLQVQNDAADGKLFIGALFSFYNDKARAFFERKLAEATPQERDALLAELAGILAIDKKEAEEKAAQQGQEERSRLGLGQQIEAASDRADYLAARQVVAEGGVPDAETLQGAQRYRQRQPAPAAAQPSFKKGERRTKTRKGQG